jgi:hypothetical protein
MIVAGTDYIASSLGREFEYYYQNDVIPKFDGQGVYSTRHERADQRPSGANLWILGEEGDALYEAAEARTKLPVTLQCGPDGRCIRFLIPSGIVKLNDEPIRFGGDPAESEMALVVLPTKVSGDADTPSHIEAIIGQSATLLTSA